MTQHTTSPTPATALLAGALAGLLGVAIAAGCGGSDDPASASPGPASGGASSAGAAGQAAAGKAGSGGAGAAGASQGGAAGAGGSDSFEKIVSEDTPISYQEFLAKCDAWGGLVQTTASCAGNNACKGYSYLDGTLTEHSCKGMNGCGPGMSCVVLDADKGRTGKQLYEVEDGCATTCHAEFKEDGVNTNHFTLYVRPGTVSLDEAKKRFVTGNKRRLASIIAFGVVGVNDDGIAYANMPAAHTTYSVAEIDRVIDYIRTLPLETKYYTITGAPDGAGGAGGAAGSGGAAGAAGTAGAAAAGAGGTSGAGGVGGAAGSGGSAAGAAGAGG